MKQDILTRKIKKLNSFSTKLNEVLENKTAYSSFEIGQLYLRIKSLVRDLKTVVSNNYLRKAMGAAAIIFGLSFANNASAQNFLSPKENPFGLDTAYRMSAPAFVDLDGDGDLDVMIGTFGGQWNYFENVGTAKNPSFTKPVLNPYGLDTVGILCTPTFADFDDDGDYDLMAGNTYFSIDTSGYSLQGRLLYYENIGTSTSPNFTAYVANPFGADTSLYYSFPTVADLDDDGDYDILVGEYYGNMEYLENIGTASAPEFAMPVDLPFGMNHVYQSAIPTLADFDADGDFDLLVSNYYGLFTYFENIGSKSAPKFDVGQNDPFNMNDTLNGAYLTFSAAADLDDDGDVDVLLGTIEDVLKYYEQGTISSKEEINKNNISVFPNPTTGQLNIGQNNYNHAEIIDILGKTIISEYGNITNISLDNLNPGTYTLRLSNNNGETFSQVISKI